jgi:hypothetical protein
MATPKQTVDTPQKNAWFTQVQQSGFVPPQVKPHRVVIGTMTAKQYKEEGYIFNGRGKQ